MPRGDRGRDERRRPDAARAPSPTDGEPVLYRSGVEIAGTVVVCDAARARGLCFVSHAGVATRAGRGQVLTTARTRALLDAARAPDRRPGEAGGRGDATLRGGGTSLDATLRDGGVGSSVAPRVAASAGRSGSAARRGAEPHLVTPFGRPFLLGALRLELYPSGRLPGAASLVVTVDGRRVAYAGEINSGGGSRLAEACEVRGADVLVVAAPLAALGVALPARADVEAALVDAVRAALDAGALPVVLAPPLGAAEEAFAALAAAGVPVRAHHAIARTLAAYRAAGVALPDGGAPSAGRERTPPPGALLWPIAQRESAGLRRLTAGARRVVRIAACGLALAPDAAARLGVDVALPLADHADLDGLVACVRASGARRVFLTAGDSDPVRRALADVGARATALGPPRQMTLW